MTDLVFPSHSPMSPAGRGRWLWRALVLLPLIWLSGCAASGPGARTAADAMRAPAGWEATLPATFTGEFPCASCPGILHHLNLFPDGAFHLRSEYRERPGAFDDIGRWVLATDRSQIALQGSGQAPVYFRLLPAGDLQQLDGMGQELLARYNTILSRAAGFEPLEPELPMRGMFRYFADAALFRECGGGQRWPVAMEGAYIDLERAYLAATLEPGEDLLVGLVGRVEMRPPMEGDGLVPTLVVLEYGEAMRRDACPPHLSNQPLTGTRWELEQLGDLAVSGIDRVPELQLDAAGRVAGFGGCNRFTGGYQQDGNALRFGALASTKMACLDDFDLEPTLFVLLDEVRYWRVTASRLDLLDTAGKRLAAFRATDTDN